ncbi:MAG: thioredoxin-disulfide reductase [SAR324 cluster bacterium]|uniref:Thioredoxin reductase n=1 Tax=SAR324 cluster bacterium TaxID=2024889 RepID=A0A7X9FRU3_9DELT|nr:thioredoxin-disulfide reductase [SAR324 cluster bacterium]
MSQGNEKRKVTIIGSGPAALTAAIYSARAGLAPLVFQGPLPGGQLTTTTEVENFPGFVDGIMGPDLMENMEKQARRFGAKLLMESVEKVELEMHPFLIKTSKSSIESETLIISTGANPKYLGLPNEKELLGYGLSTCATCDGAFYRDKIIMVVGGGDSACEEALFLTRFGKKVYLVHRRDELRASKIMQKRVLAHEKIEVLWNRVPVAINGDRLNGVKSVTLKDTQSGVEENIETRAIFYAIGHTPNSELFKDYLDLDSQGYIITAPDSTATKIPGVFACGDVRDRVYRQAITAAASGCMAAIEAERWLEIEED